MRHRASCTELATALRALRTVIRTHVPVGRGIRMWRTIGVARMDGIRWID